MHHFRYDEAGVLCAEGVPLPVIARAVGGSGTPVYVYAAATLRRHYRVFRDALHGLDSLIAYSLKANPNLSVLRLLADLGAGADVVSGGELDRARRVGIPPERIVFSGVGKTESEISEAVAADILQFNVESVAELAVINRVAGQAGRRAPIAFRVNPDVTAGGHAKIATGHRSTKFGVPIDRARELYARARAMPGITVTGIDVHIGSQILDAAPFRSAFGAVVELAAQLRADGHDIRVIDVGGGIGIPYGAQPGLAPETYADVVRATLGTGTRLVFEPGRLIVGNAGMLLASVLYMKEDSERRFVILDAAMNDLLRPHPVRCPPPARRRAATRRAGGPPHLRPGGAGLRIRRHLRRGRPPAAARGRRPRGVRHGRGLRRRDGFRVQFPSARPRGHGFR